MRDREFLTKKIKSKYNYEYIKALIKINIELTTNPDWISSSSKSSSIKTKAPLITPWINDNLINK